MAENTKYLKNQRNQNYKSDFKYAINIPRIHLTLIGNWPLQKRDSVYDKVKTFIHIGTISVLISFFYIPQLIYTFVDCEDLSRYTYVLASQFFTLLSIIKYWAVIINRKELRYCLMEMEAYYRDVEEERDRLEMKKWATIGRNFTIFYLSLIYGGGIPYNNVMPWLADKIVREDNTTVLPLIYQNDYVFFVIEDSPYYEILFIVQMLTSTLVMTVNIGIHTLMINIAMHSSGLFAITSRNINALFENRRRGLRECLECAIRNHVKAIKFTSTVEKSWSYVFLSEMVGITLIICLVEYGIVRDIQDGKVFTTLSYIALTLSFFVVVFILSFIGECIKHESEMVGEAAYLIQWYNLPDDLAKNVKMIILRSNKPVTLSAGKLFDMSLQGFCDVCKTSAAYFNFLRTIMTRVTQDSPHFFTQDDAKLSSLSVRDKQFSPSKIYDRTSIVSLTLDQRFRSCTLRLMYKKQIDDLQRMAFISLAYSHFESKPKYKFQKRSTESVESLRRKFWSGSSPTITQLHARKKPMIFSVQPLKHNHASVIFCSDIKSPHHACLGSYRIMAKVLGPEDLNEDVKYAVQFAKKILWMMGTWPLPPNAPASVKIKVRIKNVIAYSLFLFTIVPGLLRIFLISKAGVESIKILGPVLNCSMQFAKYTILLIRSEEIRKSIEVIDEDWKAADETDRKILLSKARDGRRVVLMSAITMYVSGMGYRTVVPLSKGTIVTANNVTIRPLAMPCYLIFFNEQITPVYEIVFIVQAFAGFAVYSMISGSVGICTILVLHVCSKLKMLANKMTALTETKSLDNLTVHKKIADIVEYQINIKILLEKIEKITEYICLVETLGGVFLICLAGYYVLLALGGPVGNVIIHATMLYALTVPVFMLCYISQLLDNEVRGTPLSDMVFTSRWEKIWSIHIFLPDKMRKKIKNDEFATSPLIVYIMIQLPAGNHNVGQTSCTLDWYRLDTMQARSLVLIIATSNVSKILTAGKMVDMSLATFTSIIKVSVAYLNILREVV
ncbi:uncharacterized protein LOC143180124 [Calliopsis andreniformis]|uniref:uncharacterized protein LOC143180124 n=1 Tax=Calliopsis andreniformis TaxID=337506 RepID=UPI003FCCCA19